MSETDAHTMKAPGQVDPAWPVPIAEESLLPPRRSRFRFRIGTLLFAIAVLALSLVVILQQLQLERLRSIVEAQRRQIDADTVERVQLRTHVEALRDMIDREDARHASKSKSSSAPDHR